MLRLALSFLFLVLVCAPAAAQTPSPLSYWQFSVGQVLTPLGGPIPDWRYNFGLGTMVQPQYEGGDRYEILPSAVFDIRYRDIAFLSDGEGLGVNLLRGPSYRAGVALTYDTGRNHSDDPRLETLHNVDPAPEVKLFAQAFILPFVLTADLRQGIGGHDGLIGDLGAYVPIPVVKNLYLFAGPSVTFANGTYMRSYFSVSQREALNSPLTPFNAHGGLKSAGFGLTGVYLWTDHWLLITEAAFKELLGDAGASPIVEDRAQFTLGVNVVYHF